MNSLLFLAKSKINDDFYSMLIVEFFNYLDSRNKEQITSFYDYLSKKLDYTLKWLKEENKSINLDIKSLTIEEIGEIEKSVEEINEMKKRSYPD